MGLHHKDRNEMFVELLTNQQRSLYGFIYTLVPNRADAEDLLSETTLELWRKFSEFELGSDFRAWSCQIARFKALNFLKQRRRNRVRFNDELVVKLAEVREARTEMYSAVQDALADCIQKLNESDRHLIKLCYGKGCNIKAAAEQLERPVASVYNSLSRIRRVLLDCIQQTIDQENHE